MKLSSMEKKLSKSGLGGIGLGIFALIACELPLILAMVGLGTLSAAANALSPPFWLEVIGLISALLGFILLFGLLIRYMILKNRKALK